MIRRPSSPARVSRVVRAWILPAVPLLLVAALASCQGTGGGGGTPIPYEQLRGDLERAYGAVEQTISAGSFDQVASYSDALSRELDRIEGATRRWGFLEREKMKLHIATARRGIQTVVRTAPVSGDIELLQAQLRPVGESVQEVSALLAQAQADAAARSSP